MRDEQPQPFSGEVDQRVATQDLHRDGVLPLAGGLGGDAAGPLDAGTMDDRANHLAAQPLPQRPHAGHIAHVDQLVRHPHTRPGEPGQRDPGLQRPPVPPPLAFELVQRPLRLAPTPLEEVNGLAVFGELAQTLLFRALSRRRAAQQDQQALRVVQPLGGGTDHLGDDSRGTTGNHHHGIRLAQRVEQSRSRRLARRQRRQLRAPPLAGVHAELVVARRWAAQFHDPSCRGRTSVQTDVEDGGGGLRVLLAQRTGEAGERATRGLSSDREEPSRPSTVVTTRKPPGERRSQPVASSR